MRCIRNPFCSKAVSFVYALLKGDVEDSDGVVWVNNRLGDGDGVHGYRDVLLLLSIDGHCELQLHLRALYDVKNGHAAYAFAGLVDGDRPLRRRPYEGQRNDHDQMHGFGKYRPRRQRRVPGPVRERKMSGQGTFTYADGEVYTGSWKDGKVAKVSINSRTIYPEISIKDACKVGRYDFSNGEYCTCP